MNWFTKSYVSGNSLKRKEELVTEWGGCEHVEADPSVMAVVAYENDSFGREGYCMCEACDTAADAEEGEREVTCTDCKGTFKQKETREWRWYDFYAAQGDEPYVLCEACRKAEKHLARVRKDQADYEKEQSTWGD
jgi:hypothetical protein